MARFAVARRTAARPPAPIIIRTAPAPAPIAVRRSTGMSPATKSKIATLEAGLKRARSNAAGKVDLMEVVGAAAAGALLSGLLDAWEVDNIMGMDARIAIGGGMIAAGFFGLAPGRWSRLLIAAGVGVLGPSLANISKGLLESWNTGA